MMCVPLSHSTLVLRVWSDFLQYYDRTRGDMLYMYL